MHNDCKASRDRRSRRRALSQKTTTSGAYGINKSLSLIYTNTPSPSPAPPTSSLIRSYPVLYSPSLPNPSSENIIRPALLLRPHLLVVRLSMHPLLRLIRRHNLLFAKRALSTRNRQQWSQATLISLKIAHSNSYLFRIGHTFDIGVGALTGLPLGFTGARVPAASAFLCSRLICRRRRAHGQQREMRVKGSR